MIATWYFFFPNFSYKFFIQIFHTGGVTEHGGGGGGGKNAVAGGGGGDLPFGKQRFARTIAR